MGFWSSLGGLVKGALPIAGGIFGGPLGGALGGALGGLLGGGGGQGALKGAAGGGLAGFGMDQFKQANERAQADQKRAHELANTSVDWLNQGRQTMQNQWNMGAPMRDAFRFGAFNFGDPSNPFTRGNQMFAPFAANLQQESGQPQQQAPSQPTRKAKPSQPSQPARKHSWSGGFDRAREIVGGNDPRVENIREAMGRFAGRFQ